MSGSVTFRVTLTTLPAGSTLVTLPTGTPRTPTALPTERPAASASRAVISRAPAPGSEHPARTAISAIARPEPSRRFISTRPREATAELVGDAVGEVQVDKGAVAGGVGEV